MLYQHMSSISCKFPPDKRICSCSRVVVMVSMHIDFQVYDHLTIYYYMIQQIQTLTKCACFIWLEIASGPLSENSFRWEEVIQNLVLFSHEYIENTSSALTKLKDVTLKLWDVFTNEIVFIVSTGQSFNDSCKSVLNLFQ